jgi:hypothetical protein
MPVSIKELITKGKTPTKQTAGKYTVSITETLTKMLTGETARTFAELETGVLEAVAKTDKDKLLVKGKNGKTRLYNNINNFVHRGKLKVSALEMDGKVFYFIAKKA